MGQLHCTPGGGFFQVWAAQRVALPSRWRCPVTRCNWLALTSTAGTGAVELQLLAHLSCDLTGQSLVEKPPGLHLAQIAVQGQRLALAPRSSFCPRPTCLRGASPSRQASSPLAARPPTHTRRIGWHDANRLRRLDARGDRARPDGGLVQCYCTSHQAPASTAVTGWLFSPVPSMTRICPCN